MTGGCAELMQPRTEPGLGEEACGAGVVLRWRRQHAEHRRLSPAGAQQLGGEVRESARQARLGLAERGVLRKAFFPCAVWIDPLLRPNDTLINNSCWQYRLSGADPRAPQRKPSGRAPWVRRLSARSGAEVMW